jgi:hypothetical protein
VEYTGLSVERVFECFGAHGFFPERYVFPFRRTIKKTQSGLKTLKCGENQLCVVKCSSWKSPLFHPEWWGASARIAPPLPSDVLQVVENQRVEIYRMARGLIFSTPCHFDILKILIVSRLRKAWWQGGAERIYY